MRNHSSDNNLFDQGGNRERSADRNGSDEYGHGNSNYENASGVHGSRMTHAYTFTNRVPMTSPAKYHYDIGNPNANPNQTLYCWSNAAAPTPNGSNNGTATNTPSTAPGMPGGPAMTAPAPVLTPNS